jgi:hypothetical protein
MPRTKRLLFLLLLAVAWSSAVALDLDLRKQDHKTVDGIQAHEVPPERSSVIRSVGYDLRTNTLQLSFPDGRVYQYFDVPFSQVEALAKAPSMGSYFHSEIRDRYFYKQVWPVLDN